MSAEAGSEPMPELARPPEAPRFRVVQLPRWKVEGDHLVVEDPETGHPQTWNLWPAGILEGLAQGEAYEALVQRMRVPYPDQRRRYHEKTLRRFLFTLHRLGAIDIHLEQPRSFADGRYEVVKELGRGGVGAAWLARDAATGREVVVKRPWDYFATLAKTDALMRAELAVMRSIEHPRVARAYDAFEEHGLLHIVREFARGHELARWRTTGVQPAPVRRRLAREIASIVGHLHERGFVLLDLRPANFFVDPATMEPMLIDVGHCKPLVEGAVDLGLPKKGKAHASPGFAAPETYAGRATPRSDVWGFGRLYSFMATGQLPRAAQSTEELLARMRASGAQEEDVMLVATCSADEEGRRPGGMGEVVKLLGG